MGAEKAVCFVQSAYNACMECRRLHAAREKHGMFPELMITHISLIFFFLCLRNGWLNSSVFQAFSLSKIESYSYYDEGGTIGVGD